MYYLIKLQKLLLWVMTFILSLCSVVILSAIFTNKFLNRLGIPTLLFFLFMGMIFGSKINFTNFNFTKELSSIALGFIIFYGGFCTKWSTAKPIIIEAGILSTLGVLLTAIVTGLFCNVVLKLGLLESFLIGAVISSTDAASVFSILKAKRLNLKENTAPLLEIESGSNDPMSYVLVVLAITLMQGNSAEFVIILFFKQMIFGILIGIFIKKVALYIFKKTSMITDGNEPLFIIALVLLAYSLPDVVDGNPFLAVYFLGILLGNSEIPNKVSVMSFFDGITKLAQIGIFFTLGMLATPQKAVDIILTGSLIFIFLTLIARPLAILILLKPFKSSCEQILLTAWSGLRGAASIVFAIIAMNEVRLNYDLFHLVFLVSILSVAIQGTLLSPIAKKLNMLDKHSDIRKTFNNYHEECAIKFLKATVPPNHEWIGKKIKDITFPQNSLVLFIKREGKRILPKESTKIKESDKVTLVLPSDYIPED